MTAVGSEIDTAAKEDKVGSVADSSVIVMEAAEGMEIGEEIKDVAEALLFAVDDVSDVDGDVDEEEKKEASLAVDSSAIVEDMEIEDDAYLGSVGNVHFIDVDQEEKEKVGSAIVFEAAEGKEIAEENKDMSEPVDLGGDAQTSTCVNK